MKETLGGTSQSAAMGVAGGHDAGHRAFPCSQAPAWEQASSKLRFGNARKTPRPLQRPGEAELRGSAFRSKASERGKIPGIYKIMQVLAYAVRWHVPEPERRAWWTSAAIQPRPSFLRDVPPAPSCTKCCQQTHNPVNAWATENEKRRGRDSAVGWHVQSAAVSVVAGFATPFLRQGVPPSQGLRTAFRAVDP